MNQTDLDAILQRAANIRIVGAVVFHVKDAVRVLESDVPALVEALQSAWKRESDAEDRANSRVLGLSVRALEAVEVVNAHNSEMIEKLKQTEKQLAIYQAALQEYANPDNWEVVQDYDDYNGLYDVYSWRTRSQYPPGIAQAALEHAENATIREEYHERFVKPFKEPDDAQENNSVAL